MVVGTDVEVHRARSGRERGRDRERERERERERKDRRDRESKGDRGRVWYRVWAVVGCGRLARLVFF